MYCTKCGKFIRDDDIHCPFCGARVSDEIRVAGNDESNQPAGDNSSSENAVNNGETKIIPTKEIAKAQEETKESLGETKIIPNISEDMPMGSFDTEDDTNEIIFEDDEIKDFDFPEDMDDDNLIFHEDDNIRDNDDDILLDEYYDEEPGNDMPVVGSNKKANIIAICVAVAVVIEIVVTAVVLSKAFSNTGEEVTTALEETTVEETELEETTEEEYKTKTETVKATEAEETTREPRTEAPTKKPVVTKAKVTKAPATTAVPKTTKADIPPTQQPETEEELLDN